MGYTYQTDTGNGMLDKDTNWIHTSGIQYQASSICPPRGAKFISPDRKHQELSIYLFIDIDMLDSRLEKEGAQLHFFFIRGKADHKFLFTGHPLQAFYVR